MVVHVGFGRFLGWMNAVPQGCTHTDVCQSLFPQVFFDPEPSRTEEHILITAIFHSRFVTSRSRSVVELDLVHRMWNFRRAQKLIGPIPASGAFPFARDVAISHWPPINLVTWTRDDRRPWRMSNWGQWSCSSSVINRGQPLPRRWRR